MSITIKNHAIFKTFLAIALVMSFNPFTANAAYANELIAQSINLTSKNITVVDDDSENGYTCEIIGDGLSVNDWGEVDPSESVKSVVVKTHSDNKTYTIKPGGNTVLDVIAEESFVEVSGSYIIVEDANYADGKKDVYTYHSGSGDTISVYPSSPLNYYASNAVGVYCESYDSNGNIYRVSVSNEVPNIDTVTIVYQATDGKINKSGLGNYSNYDKKIKTVENYYDGSITSAESEYKSGNTTITKKFTGDDLDVDYDDNTVGQFETLVVKYPDNTITYNSYSSNGVADAYGTDNTVHSVNEVSTSTSSEPIYSNSGSFEATANEDGEIISAVDASGNVVKPNVELFTVKFVDWDDTVISSQQVVKGENATAPANPKRSGYTFKGWSGSYKNVKADTTVKATYTKNSAKKNNTISVAPKTLKLKKSSKARTVKISKLFTVKNAKGKVTYTKVSKGSSKKLTLKNGKVTIAKNTRGNLKLKVKVKAAGNSGYKAKTVTKTATVKIS